MDKIQELEEWKKAIAGLSEKDAKSLLLQILLRLKLVGKTNDPEIAHYKEVENVYDMVFKLSNEKSKEEKANFQKVHILFGAASAGSLNMSLKKMGADSAEKVICLWDILSVGPIWALHSKAGQEARMEWLKSRITDEHGDFKEQQQRFFQTVHEIDSIPGDVPITIWAADNADEQTGLRFVLYLLRNKTNGIKVMNTTKLHAKYFKPPEIEYSMLHTGEIPPEKWTMMYKEDRFASMSMDERGKMETEWEALADTKETLRIWKNEKIKSVNEDYYDSFMINMTKKLQLEREREQESEPFMKSARLIGEVIGHLNQYVGDDFLEYRLRKLIEMGVFEKTGSLKAMRYYSIRVK
ncbi:DUF1835 domain-containing protein [Bacillus massiliglaciei]|uniref:DUF1835 domain-containing protein n=1 Tax=Bacillus massiliglaciei TaxID=1816693 RepID=UPI000AD16F7E|nr:DUF1835 domain-containing protein [Bacillus massiliglaciei]